MPSYDPAPWHQSIRGLFRVVGVLATAAGVILIVLGVSDLFTTPIPAFPPGFGSGGGMHAFDQLPTPGPAHPSEAFYGILLTFIGVWCLKLGFLGTATRYAADAVVPEVGPAARYLAGEIRAGLGTPDQGNVPGDTSRETPEQRLQQLARLREQGLITADEYARQRQAIIQDV